MVLGQLPPKKIVPQTLTPTVGIFSLFIIVRTPLKRIRKAPLLLSQEESLVEKVKKYPCLLM